MIKVYSEHRLNEDWFLRSKGFVQRPWPNRDDSTGVVGRGYSTERNDRGVSLREFYTSQRGRMWVASCSGVNWQGRGDPDVEVAFVRAELANWGRP